MDSSVARALLAAHRLPRWREHPVRVPELLAEIRAADVARSSASTRRVLASSPLADPEVLAVLLGEAETQVAAAANPRTPFAVVAERCPDLSYLRSASDVQESAALLDGRRQETLRFGALALEHVEAVLEAGSEAEARTLLANPQLGPKAARLVVHRHDHLLNLWLDRDDLPAWEVGKTWDRVVRRATEPEWVLAHPRCPVELAVAVAGDAECPYPELTLLHPRLPLDVAEQLWLNLSETRPVVMLGAATWATLATRHDVNQEWLTRVPVQQLWSTDPRGRPSGRMDTGTAFLAFAVKHATSAEQVEWLLSNGRWWRADCWSLLECSAEARPTPFQVACDITGRAEDPVSQ